MFSVKIIKYVAVLYSTLLEQKPEPQKWEDSEPLTTEIFNWSVYLLFLYLVW